MAFKVHLQNIWPAPAADQFLGKNMARVYDCAEEIFRRVFGADAQIQQGYNSRSTYYCSRLYIQQYNNIGLLEGLAQAQADGCDAAVIVCGNDPALMAAREAFTMPIVGITESAMLIASMLGRRFAAISMDDESRPLVEANLAAYGLESRAIRNFPVRVARFMEDFSRWYIDEAYFRAEVIPKFEAVARTAIADGAEVIVTACGGFGVFTQFGYNKISGTDVPVIEATLAGAQMALVLASLKKVFGVTTSKHDTFKSLPPEIAANCLAGFYRTAANGG